MLARPDYEALRPGLVQRLLETVSELLGRWLAWLVEAGATTTLVGALAVALVMVILGVLALWFLRGLRPDAAAQTPLTGGSGRSAVQWTSEAVEHERAQRWREALRCHYRSLLADLASRGLIEEVPGRTSGEYLRAATAALPAARPALEAVTQAFESAWYARAAVTGEQVAAVRTQAEQVRAAADGQRRVAVGAPA